MGYGLPMSDEGVTKFSFERTDVSASVEPVVRDLTEERRELYLRDSIGCNMKRYGACYGNASARVGAFGAPAGRREFIVSGTQTGNIASPGPEHWVRITRYDHAANRVWAAGPCDPSSESLTHAAIYDADLAIRSVMHGHDRHTWLWLLESGAPATAPHIGYGTQAMATAAAAIVRGRRSSTFRYPGVFAMSGHEDGVVAWGDSVKEATRRFIAVYDAARLR
jgi:ribulose-5-phosphate 4-epimerase/fuculose-1-phosphate aldolase